MDPLGNTPVFNSMLARFPVKRRSRIVARELVFALFILLTFLFAGTAILDFLGLSQPSLSIASGVLLFIIALRMIFPRPATEEPRRACPVLASYGAGSRDDEPFIVPLAMPMRGRSIHA